MEKFFQRRTVKGIIALIVFIIFFFINNKYSFIYIPNTEANMKDYQFNIITICTVFAGFSFTVLGLLISLSSSEVMVRLKETTILSKQCSLITDSIVMFILSAIVSIFFIFGLYKEIIGRICNFIKMFSQEDAIEVMYIIGIGYLICGILIFVMSVKNMVVLMNYIFEEDIRKGRQKAEKFLEAADKQKKDMEMLQEDEHEKNIFKTD